MLASLIIAATGLLAGAAHVFAGPDHLAAVAPIATTQRRQSWLLGLLWGAGHSSGVWLLALMALIFRSALPLETISQWSERLVGVVLILVGLWGVRRLLSTRVHAHVHQHQDEAEHVHMHVHSEGINSNHPHQHQHSHSALGVGMLHGLAGTSHLLGVLPAVAFAKLLESLSYLIGFGLGSMISMTLFTWGMGTLASAFEHRGTMIYRTIAGVGCAAAIMVGINWLWLSLTGQPTHTH